MSLRTIIFDFVVNLGDNLVQCGINLFAVHFASDGDIAIAIIFTWAAHKKFAVPPAIQADAKFE